MREPRTALRRSTELARWCWGTWATARCWGTWATALHLGVTRPAHGISALDAAAIEALLTFVLLMAILSAVSSKRTAPWTPVVAWGTVALLVWQGAAWTGASLNPARSLAPRAARPRYRRTLELPRRPASRLAACRRRDHDTARHQDPHSEAPPRSPVPVHHGHAAPGSTLTGPQASPEMA